MGKHSSEPERERDNRSEPISMDDIDEDLLDMSLDQAIRHYMHLRGMKITWIAGTEFRPFLDDEAVLTQPS